MYRLTKLSLDYPKSSLATIVAITIVLGFGMTRLYTEFGYRVLIGESHPAI